jgi:ABC-type Mn2+/Zn2+ transport system permease subunit
VLNQFPSKITYWLNEFIEILLADYFRNTLLAVLFFSLLAALLSPLIVLSRKSFVPDALSHMVLPGVCLGLVLELFLPLDKWILVTFCCFFSGFFGLKYQQNLERKLNLGTDASTIILLGLFFSAGVLLSRIADINVDLHSILFGDPLGASTSQVIMLALLFAVCAALVNHLKHDVSAWICDREFALVSGYKVKQVELFFAVAITATVLLGIWSVGSLMVSAFLTLPQVISRSESVLKFRTFLVALLLGFVGICASVLGNLPLGATSVFLGTLIVVLRSIFARK